MQLTTEFFRGLKKGLPIAFGYIPIAITFGVLARSINISPQAIILMSILVFAGASQFVAINLLALGAGFWEITITTFIVNFRHFLMSSYIAQLIKDKVPAKAMPWLAFGITDESFTFLSLTSRKELTTSFIAGLNLIGYLGWIMGTVIGVFLEQGLPQVVQTSMGIALYAMFIGLLIPNFKDSKPLLIISILAMLLSSILHITPGLISQLPDGWKIILTTVTAAIVGAILFPKEAERLE